MSKGKPAGRAGHSVWAYAIAVRDPGEFRHLRSDAVGKPGGAFAALLTLVGYSMNDSGHPQSGPSALATRDVISQVGDTDACLTNCEIGTRHCV